MVIKQKIVEALNRLGATKETEMKVHCSLSSFGTVCGGAEMVIDALKSRPQLIDSSGEGTR